MPGLISSFLVDYLTAGRKLLNNIMVCDTVEYIENLNEPRANGKSIGSKSDDKMRCSTESRVCLGVICCF
jgi:hypothetical protein